MAGRQTRRREADLLGDVGEGGVLIGLHVHELTRRTARDALATRHIRLTLASERRDHLLEPGRDTTR